MKKAALLLVMLIHFSKWSFSQCNVKENKREDGIVKYITPLPIGHREDIIAAFGLETNGRDYFVTLWTLYKYEAKKARGVLILRFDDNSSVQLPIYLSQKTILNGLNATISTYSVKQTAIALIKSRQLKTIGFQEEDDTLRIVPAEQNQGILSDDYYCLTK